MPASHVRVAHETITTTSTATATTTTTITGQIIIWLAMMTACYPILETIQSLQYPPPRGAAGGAKDISNFTFTGTEPNDPP